MSRIIIKSSVEQALIAWGIVARAIGVTAEVREINPGEVTSENVVLRDDNGEELRVEKLTRQVHIISYKREFDVDLVGYRHNNRTYWHATRCYFDEPDDCRWFEFLPAAPTEYKLATTLSYPTEERLWDVDNQRLKYPPQPTCLG